jgi:Domain of unknown function (DUF4430)
MGARRLLVAWAILGVVGGGCGSRAAAPPPGPAAVTVTVTREFGRDRVDGARAAPGQSALDALRRTARVDTSYGGRFVQAIDGVHGDRTGGWDWLYFINGVEADRGAADYRLRPGDREWWDYRYWNDLIHVPVTIGAWPEPFVHGFDGHRPPAVDVTGLACSADVAGTLRAAGVRLTRRPSPFTVRVETFAQAAAALAPGLWRGRGLTVYLDRGRVMVYRTPGGPRPDPRAHALIAAYQPGEATGRSAELIVAGDIPRAACAAARTLAEHPGAVADTYAVALDGGGHVVAAGGRR